MPTDTDDDSAATATATGTEATRETEVREPPLPWYHSWINLAVVALAIAVLAGGAGYVVGNNRAIPDPNSTDIGFMQDMRFHHEQAVTMGMIFISRPDTSPGLRTIAREIIVGQSREIGRMIQLLRDYGEFEANQTDVAMGWMGNPTPLERMPGLATAEDLDTLLLAEGADADQVFVRLMVAHHEGGIHMAEHAAAHAGTSEVREMAGAMVESQQHEIVEMEKLTASPSSG